ncbi:hypothetical protein [Flavobacterium sp.]|uniref:hypothetical protein n=1 Tax=Flavobacterium sp. TaxID=239 RepID=UPI003A942FE1
MVLLGFIQEYNKVDGVKTLTEVLNKKNYSTEVLGKIILYLQQGVVISSWMGVFTDVFNNKEIDYVYYSTDGVYIWPSYLSYYITNYEMHLPEDFLEFLEKKNYSIQNIEYIRNNVSFYENELISKM